MITSDSRAIFRVLNGILNVYKPSGVSVKRVINAIVTNICKGIPKIYYFAKNKCKQKCIADLNQLNVREPRSRLLFEQTNNDSYNVQVISDPADHIKVVGERHQIADFRCQPAMALGHHTSGVLLLGLNSGTRDAFKIRMNRPVRVYRVTGKLGKATETHFANSRIIARSSYDHVSRGKISGLLSSIQASHQKKMFELCGVDIQSETAYNLATMGTIRPAASDLPVIYGITLVELARPYFTVEIHALNEKEDYLATLIHEIGLDLRTVAHCTAIRCLRCGYFSSEGSLLRGNWTLPFVVDNIQANIKIIQDHPSIIHQKSSSLVDTESSNQIENSIKEAS